MSLFSSKKLFLQFISQSMQSLSSPFAAWDQSLTEITNNLQHSLAKILELSDFQDSASLIKDALIESKQLQEKILAQRILLEQLHILSQIQTDQLHLQHHAFAPIELINTIVEKLKPTTRHYQVKILVNEPNEPLLVIGDGRLYFQILYGLVNEVIKQSYHSQILLALTTSQITKQKITLNFTIRAPFYEYETTLAGEHLFDQNEGFNQIYYLKQLIEYLDGKLNIRHRKNETKLVLSIRLKRISDLEKPIKIFQYPEIIPSAEKEYLPILDEADVKLAEAMPVTFFHNADAEYDADNTSTSNTVIEMQENANQAQAKMAQENQAKQNQQHNMIQDTINLDEFNLFNIKNDLAWRDLQNRIWLSILLDNQNRFNKQNFEKQKLEKFKLQSRINQQAKNSSDIQTQKNIIRKNRLLKQRLPKV